MSAVVRALKEATEMTKIGTSTLTLSSSEAPPTDYDRPPTYQGMVRETNVYVPMRDGVKVCVDIYRPDTTEKLPALLAFAIYNKDFQGPDVAKELPPQPAWTPLWDQPARSRRHALPGVRGYIHVIDLPRGGGKSEGGGSRQWDSYDLIEWIAAQPWCDGNVGWLEFPDWCRAIPRREATTSTSQGDFPVRPARRLWNARQLPRRISRGVLAPVSLSGRPFLGDASAQGIAGIASGTEGNYWREAIANPDYRMYPNILNISQKRQHMPPIFDLFVDPYEKAGAAERANPNCQRSRCRSTPAQAGTATRTRLILTARKTISAVDAKKLMFTDPLTLSVLSILSIARC
jgi:hypothetical protein